MIRAAAFTSCLLLWSAISACSSGSGTVEPRMLESKSLSDAAVRWPADPGQWQALRLDLAQLIGNEEELAIGISAEPSPGAFPYLALVIRAATPDTPDASARVFILALPEDGPSGQILRLTQDPDSPMGEDVSIDVVIAGGSNTALSRFSVGIVDPALADADVPAVLAPRPTLEAALEPGFGGVAMTYARLTDAQGERREFRAGPIEVQDEALAALPGSFEVMRQTRLRGETGYAAGGVGSFLLLGIPQAGVSEWSYRLSAPPHDLAGQGRFANIGPLSPIAIPLLELAPAAAYVQARTADGPANLEVDYTYTGREGGTLALPLHELTAQAAPDGAFAMSWGWIGMDIEALYGWPVEEVLP